MKEFFNDANRISLLSQEEEIELAKRIEKGNEDSEAAIKQMVAANIRLVGYIAKDYTRNNNISRLDIIQEGTIGLIRAAQKFEWKKGYKFSTYASFWIKQAINRYLDDKEKIIRIPVHRLQQIKRYKSEMDFLTQKLNRTPTDSEIARSLGWSVEDVNKIKTECMQTIHLEDSCSNEDPDCTVGDFIEDKKYERAETKACNTFMNIQLQKDMDSYLTETEQKVIRLRFGFDNGSVQTLEEVGCQFGLTRERIRQIEKSGISKLRAVYMRRGLDLSDCISEGA